MAGAGKGGLVLGAVIGDIVGSRFELNNYRAKDFELFHPDCFVTDDSLMTLAVCEALLGISDDHGISWRLASQLPKLTIQSMQRIGRAHPDCGFGLSFFNWIFADNPQPYGSYGNGAAMRVSGCGWAGEHIAEVESLATMVTAISHDHPEALKGAAAVAMAVFLARKGRTQDEIRAAITARCYQHLPSLEEIRPNYGFDASCQGSVPQAIAAFLETTSFEDTIRNAVSIGGDSDTIAAIAGSIAEPYFGIPESMRSAALAYLDKEQRSIVERFEALYGAKVLAS